MGKALNSLCHSFLKTPSSQNGVTYVECLAGIWLVLAITDCDCVPQFPSQCTALHLAFEFTFFQLSSV